MEMTSIRRKSFTALLLLSLFVIICLLYSESHVSRLSVVTTVNSYVYAKDTISTKKNDLKTLKKLKDHLESLIEKYSTYENVSNTTTDGFTIITPSSDVAAVSKVHQQQIIVKYTEKRSLTSISVESTTPIPSLSSKKVKSSDMKMTGDSVSTQESSMAIHSTKLEHSETIENFSEKKEDVDQMLRSLLLQALMNKTTEKGPHLLSVEAHSLSNKPACKETGKFPQEEAKSAWLDFKSTLEDYADFHREQLQKLKAGDGTVKTLTWSCQNPIRCAGIGDQLFRIQTSLVFAVAFKRVLTLHWNQGSYETMKYLQPNKIDWTYFNGSQGMHEFHETELSRIKKMDTGKEFEQLYSLLSSENCTHVTVNYELQVPFLRGMIKAIKTNHGMRAALEKTGLVSLLTDTKKRIPVNFLSGELLRYLFHFKGFVVDKVERVQKQLNISNRPYLAVHLRTGFLGMKQEESGKFNADKIYRNPEDWEKTLACSVSLADRLFGPDSSVFLATDSSKVKQLAVEKYADRFVMVNVTLQHVAFSDGKNQGSFEAAEEQHRSIQTLSSEFNLTRTTSPILDIHGVDGFVATWIEFLLLARATAMVHSISGFSSTAAQYCSMHNQYHVPNCKASMINN